MTVVEGVWVRNSPYEERTTFVTRQPAAARVPAIVAKVSIPRAVGYSSALDGRAGGDGTMDSLATIALLRGAEIDLATFDARVARRRFVPGEVLIDYEDRTTDVFFILTGEVRVLVRTRAGREVILGEIRAGALFGELAALDGIRRSANVTALTRGEVCVMTSAIFREIVFAAPTVADRLLRILTGRIRDLDARLMEHTVLDLRHRLYAELLRLSIPRAGEADGRRVVTPPPYHHVLASRIGCRREQVTREFAALDAEGLIERTRGALVLLRPAELQARVEVALRESG